MSPFQNLNLISYLSTHAILKNDCELPVVFLFYFGILPANINARIF